MSLTDDHRALVENVSVLVSKIVWKRLEAGIPSCVDFDDLYQAAMLEVCNAALRFDPTHGVKFSTYIYPRANYAITDYLREQGWGNRRDDAKAPAHYTLRSLDEPTRCENAIVPIEISSASFTPDVDRRIDLERVVERMHEPERVIFETLMDGRDQVTLCPYFGITNGQVSRHVRWFKDRWQDALREVA